MKIKTNNINIEIYNKKDKFCVLSDIHHIKNCQDKFYLSILKKIKEIKPKYILIPGDIVDSPKIVYSENINYLISFLISLASISPVIISKGNHELKNPKYPINTFYQRLKKIANIYVLDNESMIFGDYEFIGFSPSLNTYLPKYKKTWNTNFVKEFNECRFKINPNKIVILLCHSPETIILKEVQEQIPLFNKINIIICGHMHNGLTPAILDKKFKNRGIFGPKFTFFPKYCRGVYQAGTNGKLIICKSLRVITKDNLIYKFFDSFYDRNITIIKL